MSSAWWDKLFRSISKQFNVSPITSSTDNTPRIEFKVDSTQVEIEIYKKNDVGNYRLIVDGEVGGFVKIEIFDDSLINKILYDLRKAISFAELIRNISEEYNASAVKSGEGDTTKIEFKVNSMQVKIEIHEWLEINVYCLVVDDEVGEFVEFTRFDDSLIKKILDDLRNLIKKKQKPSFNQTLLDLWSRLKRIGS